MTFTAVFFQGGTENGRWKRALAVTTEAEVRQQVLALEKAGYPALWHRTEVWDAIGLPEGAPRH